MMNKKGQVLVMFIILLPILIGVCAFVIDVGIITYEKNKLSNIINLSNEEDVNVRKYLKLNNISGYKIKEKGKCIEVKYYRKSLFGSIIGIKEYKISSKVCED